MSEKKCRHRWIRKLIEGYIHKSSIQLFEIYKCPKCGIETKGEFKGIIKESAESKKLRDRIREKERMKRKR